MTTLDAIRARLRATNEFHGNNASYAIPLVDAIEAQARRSPDYAAILSRWLAGGGTLILRHELCPPVRSERVMAQAGQRGFRYPWDQCWTAVDTAMHNARTA
jgi:hypothetical protein